MLPASLSTLVSIFSPRPCRNGTISPALLGWEIVFEVKLDAEIFGRDLDRPEFEGKIDPEGERILAHVHQQRADAYRSERLLHRYLAAAVDFGS